MRSESDLALSLTLKRPQFELNVNMRLPAQGITVLFGPSGSGKTSVLRCVAGLERAQGQVVVGGDIWQSDAQRIFMHTYQRPLGYVFQEASLFEHMNVQQNLHYGIRRVHKNIGQAQSREALDTAVDLLGIGHLLARSSTSLSGGERQRVAIARALATRPRLLLLDEPLASLDMARRSEILPWLQRLREELRIPVLYVTHSMEELVRLADHVVVLDKGQVKASGALSDAMASHPMALALGEEAGVVMEGEVIQRSDADHMAQIKLGEGPQAVWTRDHGFPIGQKLRIRVLAKDVSLALADDVRSTIQNRWQGVLEAIDSDAHPSQALVRVRCGQNLILSRVTRRSLHALGLTHGACVWCQVKSVAMMPL